MYVDIFYDVIINMHQKSFCIVQMHAFIWMFCVYQEFHYRRRGSDVCLPCDCYPVGSFSRSCDPESGHCQCRPGVIGRQCNMCDNPFAEVTQTGCEGTYTSTQSVIPPCYQLLLIISSPAFLSYLWWLSEDHNISNLVAQNKVQPACCSPLSQRISRWVCRLTSVSFMSLFLK